MPLPAAPNQGAINIAKAHAENADKDVAKLDIELLRCKNELAKVCGLVHREVVCVWWGCASQVYGNKSPMRLSKHLLL